MEEKCWKQTMLDQGITWCKVIGKYAVGVRAAFTPANDPACWLLLVFFWASKRPDDYQLIPKPFFFPNVVTILLSQISFSAQFPEGSTSALRLECA